MKFLNIICKNCSFLLSLFSIIIFPAFSCKYMTWNGVFRVICWVFLFLIFLMFASNVVFISPVVLFTTEAFGRRVSHMLEMLSPCRSDHMSSFHPLTSATFILNRIPHGERAGSSLYERPVPLNTSCLPSCTFPPPQHLPHPDSLLHTDSACMWRQREREGGQG